jgi:hypothetical protein
MDRSFALRAAGVFALPAVAFGALGAGAPFHLANALLAIGAAAGSIMLAIALARRPRLVPVRARSGGDRKASR